MKLQIQVLYLVSLRSQKAVPSLA